MSMGKFGKIGLSILGAIVFTTSHAWAAPFTGAGEGYSTFTAISGPDDVVSYPSSSTLTGYTTTGGAFVCTGLSPDTSVLEEPTGACSAEELEFASVYSYSCQYEGTEDVLNATVMDSACVPFSCYDENFVPQVGCSFSFMDSVTVTGGTGVFEGSSGSWTASGTGAYAQIGVTESGGLFGGSNLSFELVGDIEFADGSVPPDDAFLENPSPGANVSGIGVVSGWSCLGGELEVEFSDADGVIGTAPVLHGSERGDTESACGDIDNGFSSLINWSLLGAGEKTAQLMRNGEEVASQTFMVTAFDTEFVTGAEGMCTIADFPDAGKNATFVWEESEQGLVLESVN